jgi:hypothetical protein
MIAEEIKMITDRNMLYPIFLKLDQLDILLVGAGNVGLEKLASLLGNAPEARITIVAPIVKPEVRACIQPHPNCILLERAFEWEDLNGKQLVICATDNRALHADIRERLQGTTTLLNVADTPDLCDFYLGSIVQKGNLKIAISTNGKSPTIAKRLKEVLNETLPPEMNDLLNQVNRIRDKIGGDFSSKVRKLNDLTKTLVEEQENRNVIKWRNMVRKVSLAFMFMVIGYFVFSYLPVKAMALETFNWYQSLDDTFHWIFLTGFVAQLIDGALGMGYGVASATVLLSMGINPAAMSGSIHTAEVFASGASGISHYKFGNVNMKLFWKLVIPGVLGAVSGAILLYYLGERYGNWIRPFIAGYTFILGIRFLLNAFRKKNNSRKFKKYSLLAAIGGFFDSFGGGGWGPIVTSTLIHSGRSFKYTVGTVSLTEFFVTFSSAFTFFQLIGIGHWQIILALVLGGTLAAPFAAKLAGRLPKKTAYLLLGLLIIGWSLRILIKLF